MHSRYEQKKPLVKKQEETELDRRRGLREIAMFPGPDLVGPCCVSYTFLSVSLREIPVLEPFGVTFDSLQQKQLYIEQSFYPFIL